MSPDQTKLRALLEQPKHRELKTCLRDRAWWWDDAADADDAGIAFVKAPAGHVDVWRVGDEAGIVVVEGDVDVGNLIAVGSSSQNTILFLGGIRAENVLNAPDTMVCCAGACEVAGLMYVATPDSEFVALGPARIGVLYSGHGDGWLTACGPTTIDVIDDHVDGKRVRARLPTLRACDLVLESLANPDRPGRLKRDAVMDAFGATTKLLRVSHEAGAAVSTRQTTFTPEVALKSTAPKETVRKKAAPRKKTGAMKPVVKKAAVTKAAAKKARSR